MATWPSAGGRPSSGNWPNSGNWPASGNWPSSSAPDPTNLAGAAALVSTGRPDRQVTIGTSLLKVGTATGAAITLTGSRAQALPIWLIVRTTGTLNTFVFDLSIDGGKTFVAVGASIPSGSTYAVPGAAGGLTLNFAAGTYSISLVYRALVESITDYKSGFTFAQATVSLQPVLDGMTPSGNPELRFDGVDDVLECTTAGVATWANSAAAVAFTMVCVVRFDANITGGSFSGFLRAASTTTNAEIAIGLNGTNWWATKRVDGGGATNANNPTAAVYGTTYVTETYCDAVHVTTLANGASVITNKLFSSAPTSTIDKMVLGMGINGNGGQYVIAEWAVYSSDQHTVLQPVLDYMTARYTALASNRIADSFFFDGGPSTPGSIGVGYTPPNDFATREHFADLRFAVGVGVTSVDVWAIPTPDSAANTQYKTVDVYLDGAALPASTLTFGGAQGLRQKQTLTLDGSAHSIQLDEQASIVNVDGVSLTAASAPNTRVLLAGDSITRGYLASIPGKGWSAQVKHGLSPAATYGTTIRGIVGLALNSIASNAGQVTATTATYVARLDGTAKNICLIALGVNDHGGGIAAATYQTQLTNLMVSLKAAMPSMPAANFVLMSPTNGNAAQEAANGAGSTLADFRTACHAVATAQSCTYIEGNGIIDGNTETVDGLHPNDIGYGKIAAVVLPVVQAL